MNDYSTMGQAGFADQMHTSVPLKTDLPYRQIGSTVPSAPQDAASPRLYAELELTATLHASSERVRYITGATGVALALCETEADEMVCRAGSGPSAPEVGTRMHIQSGITAESIRTRQTLRCDEASTDPRVNQETCKALGIESVMVMPLIVDAGVVGIFELFGHNPSAFGERDAKTLHGAAESVQLALERAVSAGFTLGRIPWAIEIEKALETPIEKPLAMPTEESISSQIEEQTQPPESGAVLETIDLEARDLEAPHGITPWTPAVFPVGDFPAGDFPESDEASNDTSDDEPGHHERSEPVPAFLARLADEAKPVAGKRWSQWFRPQW